MSKTAVVTDSNSGITQDKAKELGIQVLPMPFYIDEKLFFEDVDLTQEAFYQKLKEDSEVSTSQPSPGDVIEKWDSLLKVYDEIVHIPMSSGLSTSCETAIVLSQGYDGRVQIVDNQRISVTQKQSVMDAMNLATSGKSAGEIKKILETEKLESSIYIMVDTLKYLKKGGRITPAAAMIGSVLNIKPILQIQGEKLDSYAKARGQKQARKTMLDAMKNDFEVRFAKAAENSEMQLAVAHTACEEEAMLFAEEIKAVIPGEHQIVVDPLSLSIACHIGPGALAVACSKRVSI